MRQQPYEIPIGIWFLTLFLGFSVGAYAALKTFALTSFVQFILVYGILIIVAALLFAAKEKLDEKGISTCLTISVDCIFNFYIPAGLAYSAIMLLIFCFGIFGVVVQFIYHLFT